MVFLQMGNLDTETLSQGGTSHKDEGRDLGDTGTSQGMPNIAETSASQERGGKILPPSSQKQPALQTP